MTRSLGNAVGREGQKLDPPDVVGGMTEWLRIFRGVKGVRGMDALPETHSIGVDLRKAFENESK